MRQIRQIIQQLHVKYNTNRVFIKKKNFKI